MVGRRGRIAVVLGPLLALLLLLLARQSTRAVSDITPTAGPALASPAAGPAAGSSVPAAITADAAAASVCPGTAARSGLCGTVAGFTGFYGSWKTAGDAGAFCLEHAKQEPQASLAYTKYATGAGHVTMSGEDRQRLGYLLGRYGATTDAATAAALAILVHAAEGDTLTTDQLTTYATSLPAAVRADVTGLWSEAAQDHGPYTAVLTVTGRGAGAQATLAVRSSAGQPMAGFPVSWTGSSHGDEVTTTDSSGRATLTIATVAPGLTATAHATVSGLPADDIGVWVPRDSSVQSVAVALPTVTANAAGSWTAAPAPASLQMVKTTADPAYVSPAGAVFAIADGAGHVLGTVRTGPDGHSDVLGGLTASAGPFTVTEIAPCAQCLAAPPQSLALTPGQAGVLPIVDAVSPVRLSIEKTTPDGQPVAGALLHIRRASAPGAGYDIDLGTCLSTTAGCQPADPSQLVPGDYQVTEEQPAPGTSWSVPRMQTVPLHSGAATLVFADPRLVSIGFHKAADPASGSVDAAHESLAGAVFAVTGPALPTAAGADPTAVELGRCTTGADGTCLLPGDPLVEGTGYSWSEITAPPGFALDPSSHPFTACAAPCAGATVTAVDQARYAHVTVYKHVSGEPTTAVPGATLDLCATGLPDALAATYTAPAGSACDPGATTVASGVTDAHGAIDFGLLPPAAHYCAVERTAPAGFQLNPVPVCGDLGAAGLLGDPAPQPLALDLADTPTPPAATPAPPAPTSSPSVPPPVAPQPGPSAAVLALTKPRPTVPRAAPPTTPTAPPVVAPPAPLAFTGAEHVANTIELGMGLILLGLALVIAGRPAEGFGGPGDRKLPLKAGSPVRSSWGNRGWRRPGPSRRHRG